MNNRKWADEPGGHECNTRAEYTWDVKSGQYIHKARIKIEDMNVHEEFGPEQVKAEHEAKEKE